MRIKLAYSILHISFRPLNIDYHKEKSVFMTLIVTTISNI